MFMDWKNQYSENEYTTQDYFSNKLSNDANATGPGTTL